MHHKITIYNQGYTLLHVAAGNIDYHRQRDFFLQCVEQSKHYINAKTDQDETPLHFAAEAGYPKNAEFLLEHGADVNAVSIEGWTAVYQAAHSIKSHQRMETIKVLIQHGADVNIKINLIRGGEAPLHQIVDLYDNYIADALDIIKLLVEAGADINAKDAGDQVPIMIAAQTAPSDYPFEFQQQHVDILKYLIEMGADTDVVTRTDGKSLLSVCKIRNESSGENLYAEIISMLEEKEDDGRTGIGDKSEEIVSNKIEWM